MSRRWDQLSSLFHELAEASLERQRERLAEIANNDESLANELATLLAHADETLDFDSATDAARLVAAEIGPDTRLGRYRLLKKLGEGGMGVVYLADREQDFDQLVAIKLGRLSLDRQAAERFVRERQILAELAHPNIARLLDGGTTESGAPYLVMEFIKGQSIDGFCRDRTLGLDDTLRLFDKVCGGVSFAHQHLIIHRDIKPHNILVQDDGEPRLLDFGIAKIVDTDDVSSATMTAAPAMTPQYATPEQVRGERTTTLTDIYALGLLLYELLTGRPAQKLTPGDLTALTRVVCEEQPEPLLRALHHHADERTAAGTELLRRSRQWQQDLQNIVHRALAKEPARRYPSAQALAADIRRLLEGNPVEASGDSMWYRLGKLARKYRYRFAATGVAILSLIGLIIGLTWATVVANQARDDAQRRLGQSQELIGFMLGDLRTSLEPKVRLDILDQVGEQAMAYFESLDPQDQTDEALAQTALSLRQIGDVRLSKGEFEGAEKAFAQSLSTTLALYQRDAADGQRLFDLGQSYFWVGYAALQHGDQAAAERAWTRYLEVSQELVRRDSANLDWLLELSYAHNNLGTLDLQRGDIVAARDRFKASLEVKQRLVDSSPDHKRWRFELADTLGWLADAEDKLGRLDAALTYRRQRLERIEALALDDAFNQQIQRSYGYALLTLARQLRTVGESAAAREALLKAAEIAAGAAQFDADNLGAQEDRVRAELELAEVEALADRPSSALSRVRKARAWTADLIARDRPTLAWQRDLQAEARYVGALAYHLQGDQAAASTEIAAALAQLNELAASHPADSNTRRQRRAAFFLAGEIVAAQCNAGAANDHWQRALEGVDVTMLSNDERALHALTLQRVGRNAAAAEMREALVETGYASRWFVLFSERRPGADCRGQ